MSNSTSNERGDDDELLCVPFPHVSVSVFIRQYVCVCLCSLLLTDLTFVISLHSLRLNHLHICSYSFLFVNVL